MAFTFDTNQNGSRGAGSLPTVQFSLGATSKLLIANVFVVGSATRGPSPTFYPPRYNGLTMSLVEWKIHTTSPETSAEQWYLLNPPTGATYAYEIPNPTNLTLNNNLVSFNTGLSAYPFFKQGLANSGVATTQVGGTHTGISVGDLIVAFVTSGDNTYFPTASSGTSYNRVDEGNYGWAAQYTVKEDTNPTSMTWTEATSEDYSVVSGLFTENYPPGVSLITATGTSFTTLTPNLAFSARDTEGNTIEYNLQIGTSSDFGTGFSYYSITNTGFTPTHPYSSGQTVLYGVSGILTTGNTYYWRARAIDVTGSSVYGSWSDTNWFYVKLNTPPGVTRTTNNGFDFGTDTTPELGFRGVDEESNDIRYNLEISSETASYYGSTDFEGEIYQNNNRAQSFLGSGSYLNSISVYLNKVNSPTGNIIAKIYKHQGTFGDGGTPDGAAIDTSSNTFLAEDLSTSYTKKTFLFGSTLFVGTTYYFFSIEYADGDALNRIKVLGDNSSPTYSGNAAYYFAGTEVWFSLNTVDLNFEVIGTNFNVISGTASGFSGSPDNTDPFTSGQSVLFTVPGTSALTTGTYYWRVRGIDPTGSNTYGEWTGETYYFTITEGTGTPKPLLYYTGSSWLQANLLRYNGSAWVGASPFKYYTGSAWQEVKVAP